MKRIGLVLLLLTLAGCQTRELVSSPEEPAPSQSAPRAKAPMPPIHSAGPLTKAGVDVYMDAQEADFRKYMRGQGILVARRGNALALTVSTDRLFAGAALSDWGDAFARAFVEVAGHYDHTAIDIVCYTDARGGAEQNLALSQKRAKTLAAAFSGYGVAAARLNPSGLGAVNSRSTDPADPKNRRIEIKIVPQPK